MLQEYRDWLTQRDLSDGKPNGTACLALGLEPFTVWTNLKTIEAQEKILKTLKEKKDVEGTSKKTRTTRKKSK